MALRNNPPSNTNASNSLRVKRVARPETEFVKKPVHTSGSLEVIDGSDIFGSDKLQNGDSRPNSQASTRPWSRSSIGSIPPRNDSANGRLTPQTPTRQVSLQAVRRKQESEEQYFDELSWKEVDVDCSHRKTKNRLTNGTKRESQVSELLTKIKDKAVLTQQDNSSASSRESSFSNSIKSMNSPSANAQKIEEEKTIRETSNISNVETESESDEEDDDNEDEKEEEPRKAPNELLMEFIDCIMKKDFVNAKKLCTMILIFEPEHPEALKFQPLIEEKMKLDEEAEKEEENEEDESSGTEDSNDSDEDDSSGSSSEDSSSDDEDDDEVEEPPPRKNSTTKNRDKMK